MESRTQGSRPKPRTQKNPRPRPRTALPRTDPIEAKNRNTRRHGHRRKYSAKKKKKRCSRIFFRRFRKKKGLQKFFSGDIQKDQVLKIIFQAIYKLLTNQKIVLSSRRRQGNFRGLEASRPRPRTSKCVLEARDILEDFTSANPGW